MHDEGTDTLVVRGEGPAPGVRGEDDFSLTLERTGPSILQVLRGVGGLGGIWAGAWAGMGLVFSLALSVVFGLPMGTFASFLLPTMVSWGVSGFLTGAGFGILLTKMERKKTLDELSLGRVAIWGATGGASVSLLVMSTTLLLVFGLENVFSLVGPGFFLLEAMKAGLFGGGSAVATTALAKAARDGSGAGTLEDGED